MRYIIFSDIHGNGHAFNRFLSEIKLIDFDQLIFLGDFIGYYYNADAIIRYCRDNNVYCILGNHDDYFLKMIDGEMDEVGLVEKYGNSYRISKESVSSASILFLRSLPHFAVIDDEFSNIYLCHGSPLNYLEGRIYPDTDLTNLLSATIDYDYIICGHTHHKMARVFEDTIFLNPGSLGQQRDGRGCSYLILDTEKRNYTFHVVSYDISELEVNIDFHDPGNSKIKSVLRRIP